MANGFDIVIRQGETFSFVVHVDHIASLSGYSARMQGRGQHRSTSTVFSWSSTGGQMVLTSHGNHGDITITVAATATDDLPAPYSGVYDLEIESPAGVVTRLLEGSFYVTPEVSRA
jgi:hypothetical protein